MFKTLRICVSLLLILSVVALAADEPLIGTWKLNVVKSKFDPGPPPKSITLKYESTGPNTVKRIQDIVRANGEPNHDEISYTFDGKEYPVANSQASDALMTRHIDAYTTELIFKKGGKLVRTVRRVV